MSRWFRAYDDALDDPKVQRLSGDLFKAWFNLMCLTSKNGGQPFGIEEIEFRLRLSPAKARAVVAEFVERELLDEVDGRYISHNWDARQYKSDASNERVKQFRERKRNAECNVTEAVTVTPPDTDTDTDTETDTEQKTDTEKTDIRAVAPATRPSISEDFENFWKAYPRRDGANPKAPALKKFTAAIKSGRDPTEIIGGAERYRQSLRVKGQEGTPYVAQAVTWLNQARWTDYPANVPIAGLMSDEERDRLWAEIHKGGPSGRAN